MSLATLKLKVAELIEKAGKAKEEQEKVVDITENGATEVTPDEGKALSKVTVNVEVEQNAGGDDALDKFLTRSITHIRSEALVELTSAGCFAEQTQLISADLPNLIRCHDKLFFNCKSLTSVNLPKANYIGANAHEGNTSLENIKYPSAATVYTASFRYANNLKTVEIGVTTNFARTGVFMGCDSFDTLILRGNEMSTLSSINNFDGGAFAEDASGGTIYVPSALIESYKTATNWSVLYEAGRCNFVAIEGSEYE